MLSKSKLLLKTYSKRVRRKSPEKLHCLSFEKQASSSGPEKMHGCQHDLRNSCRPSSGAVSNCGSIDVVSIRGLFSGSFPL